ncbi:oligosaccharide repeat unit polymerase [Vibrio sp. F12]|uniref:O-antigen polymerase n=1 Tax=Vibrio sp. F12 TaxID=2070776 RepID=UPI0010BD6194|nr:O-antigen polymerase [Vibrio sp. F12]TKE90501.1 oligosaccharide repeat unit polymerase [Vibrio sp. F12]
MDKINNSTMAKLSVMSISIFDIIIAICFFIYNPGLNVIEVVSLVYVIYIIVVFVNAKCIMHPTAVFKVLLSVYLLIGGLNLIPDLKEIDENNLKYMFLFLAGFDFILIFSLCGYRSESLSLERSTLILRGLILFSIFLFLLDVFATRGIPGLMGEDARTGGITIAKILLQLNFILVAMITFSLPSKKNIFIFALIGILIFLEGFRTPLIQAAIIAVFILAAKNIKSMKSLLKITVVVSIVFMLVNSLSLIRTYFEYGEAAIMANLARAGMGDSLLLAPLNVIVFNLKESPLNFQLIRDFHTTYGEGHYFLSNITSIYGGGYSYGYNYNLLTFADTDRTRTATILAPFYVDFGEMGILIGGLILSLINFFFMRFARKSFLHMSLYLYWSSSLIIWIHNGMIFQWGNILIMLGLVGFFLYVNTIYSFGKR